MLQNALSDQGLHGLFAYRSSLFEKISESENIHQEPWNCKWTHPNDEDEQVHWSKQGTGWENDCTIFVCLPFK